MLHRDEPQEQRDTEKETTKIPRRRLTEELKQRKHSGQPFRNSPRFSSQKHRVHQTTKRLWAQGVSYQARKISMVTSLVCSIRLSRPKNFFVRVYLVHRKTQVPQKRQGRAKGHVKMDPRTEFMMQYHGPSGPKRDGSSNFSSNKWSKGIQIPITRARRKTTGTPSRATSVPTRGARKVPVPR